MIVPSNTPQPANGTSPFDWRTSLFNSVDRMMLNAGVANAYKAVYGNCTSPNSYASQGVNLMTDIAKSPSVADYLASAYNASSLLASNPGGTGGAPVSTVPLQNGGGYPKPTPIPSLTTSQGVLSPVIPGAQMALRRPVSTCANTVNHPKGRIPSGQSPNWGDAFLGSPAGGGGSFDLFSWIGANPWAALVLGLGGAAILTSRGGR